MSRGKWNDSRRGRLHRLVLVAASVTAVMSGIVQSSVTLTALATQTATQPAPPAVMASAHRYVAPPASSTSPYKKSTTPIDPRFLPSHGAVKATTRALPLPAPSRATVVVPTHVTGSPLNAATPRGYVAGQSVLDNSASGATYNVFDNPDHTQTAELYPGPVNWQDRQGRWQAIDPTIRTLADGTLHTTSGPTELQFGTSSTDSTIFSAQSSIYKVGFRPLQGAGHSAAVISGNSVSYSNVFPNTDLRFVAGTATTDALLVLHAPPSGTGDVTFTIPISISGLTASMGAGGTITFKDAAGNVIFGMPQGWMEDSKVDPIGGSGAMSPVAVQLASGGTALQVVANGAWLRDPSREYPVTIDPATFAGYSNGDTYVSDAYQNTNFNVSYDSTLGAYVDNIGYWNPGGNNITYLGYDMSPIFNHFIISATWSGMFAWSSSTSPTAFTMYPVTAAWNPSSMTWTTRASTNTSITATGTGVRNAWSSVDLTSWAVNWASRAWPNDGLSIAATWNDETYWKRLRSDEDGATGNGATPVIKVTYQWFGNPNYTFGTQASDSGYGANPPAFRGPAPGATTTMPVTVTNNGTDAWPANGIYKLTYHLLNSDGSLNTYNNVRTLMPTTVNPGQSITLNANVGPISTAGSYILQWDMVEEGVAWFSNYGSPTANFNIFVEPPPTPQSPANGAYFYSMPIALAVSSVPNATQYRFEVSADPNFGSGVIASSWQSGTSYSVSSGLTDGTTYSWRAFAANAGKNTTGPSSVSTFVYNSRVPVATKTANLAGSNNQPPQWYSAGQVIAYTVNLQNVSTVTESNVSIVDTLSAGLSVLGSSVVINGTSCSASGSNLACTVSPTGALQVQTAPNKPGLSIASNSSATIQYDAVAVGLERGCATSSNSVQATDTYGTAPAVAVPVTVCDTGLGFENWWTYQRYALGPQAQAAVNVANGNLVVQQTDGTSMSVHGHLALELRRTYNSEDTAIISAPGSVGLGWTLNVSEAGDLGDAGVGADGLIVPSLNPNSLLNPLDPLGVTLVDQDGTRHTFQPRLLGTILPVSSAAGATAAVDPQVLTAAPGDVLCVDQVYAPPAGVHLALWRYVQVPGQACPGTTQNESGASVVGWAAERPDRLRYEFTVDGRMVGIEDPEGNQLVYQYDNLLRLSRIYEPATGRGFTFAYPTNKTNETDITDPAGRLIQYMYSGTALTSQLAEVITSVPGAGSGQWQQVSDWKYQYGGCTNATANQLCTAIDPMGNATKFTYSSTYYEGTSVLGEPMLATVTERNGNATTYSYSSQSNATTTVDGSETNVYQSIDNSGRVGEVDKGVNSSETAEQQQTLYTWDTSSAPCQYVDGSVDNDLCGVWQVAGSAPMNDQGKPKPSPPAPSDEYTTYEYTPEGQVVDVRHDVSHTNTGSHSDETTGYFTQYVQMSVTPTVYCYEDQLTGSGNWNDADMSTSPGCSSSAARGGTGGADRTALFALTDRQESLTANGNAATSSAAYLTTYVTDNYAGAAPNSVPSGATPCGPSSAPTENTGSLCEVVAPGAVLTTYTYDQYGQKRTMSPPNANLSSPPSYSYTYTYYLNGDSSLAGGTPAAGWLKGVTDPTGNFVAFAYDAAGNAVRSWDRNATAANALPLSSYPGSDAAKTTPPGYTQLVYDQGGGTTFASPWRYLISTTDPMHNETSYTVNANGDQTAVRPPRGNVAPGTSAYDMTQAFDANDNLTCHLEPLEANGINCSTYVANPSAYGSTHPTVYGYDQFGNKTSMTDPDGNVTVYQYDSVNRLTLTAWTRSASGSTPTGCTTSATYPGLPSSRIACSTSTTYDELNHPIITTDASGNETHTTYDWLGRPTTVQGPRVVSGNNTESVTLYDNDGNVLEICNPRQFSEYGGTCSTGTQGATLTKQYDVLDRLTNSKTYRETASAGAAPVPGQTSTFAVLTTSYAYDADGNQVSLTAPNGGITTTAYNALDRKTSQTVPRTSNSDTNTTTWTYDANGNTLAVTAPGNRITAYLFDADNRVTDTVIGASGTNAATDGPTDVNGGGNVRTRQVYDADGHVIATYLPGAFATSVSAPDPAYEVQTTYDADGNATAQYVPRYDGSTHSDVAGAGSTQSSECPQATAQGYPTGAGVCVTTVQYDAAGRRIALLPPRHTVDSADVITYAYTDDGLLSSSTEPSPTGSGTATTSYAYDGVGRETAVTTPASSVQKWTTTTTTYTADGLVASTASPGPDTTGAATESTSYTYDAAGNQTGVQVNALGGNTSIDTTTTRYYADNSRWTVTNADQEPVPQGYGSGVWTSFVGTTRNTTGYVYDAMGNTSAVYSPAAWAVAVVAPSALQDKANSSGTPTTNTYTLDNLLSSTVVPVAPNGSLERQTDYSYDAGGRQTSQHVYLVNSSGPVSGKDGGTLGYSYYPDDRLQTQTGRDSSQITTSYDPGGEATTVASAGSTLTATYYLDGSPRTVNDGSATSTLSYDGSGALTWEQEYPDVSGVFPTSTVATTYGSADQAQSALWTTSTGLSDTTKWSYNPDGSLTSIALPNGTTDTYVPNNNDTIQSATLAGSSGQLAAWTYTYNGANQILTQGFSGAAGASLGGTFVSGAPAGTFTMTYDPALRLQSFQQGTNSAQSIGWDHNGDRTSWQTLSGGTSGTLTTTTATYNADTSIATTQVGTGLLLTSDYTPFGATQDDGCTTYSYDGFDRETQAAPEQGSTCATSTVNFTYDALGRQTSHSDTSTTTHFLGLGTSVAAEITPKAATIYEPTANGVEGVTQGGVTQFLSDDGHGTLSTAVSSDGTTVACTARFDAFGSPLGAPSGQMTNPCASGSSISDLFYRGGTRNPTTGDYQFGTRTYDPTKGTFLTPDTSPTLDPTQNPSAGTDPLTANTYAYVNGDPMNLTDPSGHHFECGSGGEGACTAEDFAPETRIAEFESAMAQANPFHLSDLPRNQYAELNKFPFLYQYLPGEYPSKTAAERAFQLVFGTYLRNCYEAGAGGGQGFSVPSECSGLESASQKAFDSFMSVVGAIDQGYDKATKIPVLGGVIRSAPSIVAGTAVFAGCEALSAGVGTVGCGVAAGAAGDAFQQYTETGSVDLGEVGLSALLGGVTAGALDAAGSALRTAIASRAATANFVPMASSELGFTDAQGNILVNAALQGEQLGQTLTHEAVHSLLTSRAGLWLYSNVQLYRYIEEGLAEGIATRSAWTGMTYPFRVDYNLSPLVVGVQAGGVAAGAGLAGYGLYHALNG